jgi:hypothetical protein
MVVVPNLCPTSNGDGIQKTNEEWPIWFAVFFPGNPGR